MSGKQLLLVEGTNDKSLHEAFCRLHDLHPDVKVAPPLEVGGDFNSKQGVLNILALQLKQLEDGQLERLGVVIDADHIASGGGYARTLALVTQTIAPHGYASAPELLENGGALFRHNDGLPHVGLWIMPNNCDDGAVETWIGNCVTDMEQALLTLAVDAVASVAIPKFRPVRRKKAEIATWLAWQDRPGEGLYYAVKGGLLNPAAPLYTGFLQWMERVFR